MANSERAPHGSPVRNNPLPHSSSFPVDEHADFGTTPFSPINYEEIIVGEVPHTEIIKKHGFASLVEHTRDGIRRLVGHGHEVDMTLKDIAGQKHTLTEEHTIEELDKNGNFLVRHKTATVIVSGAAVIAAAAAAKAISSHRRHPTSDSKS